MQFPLVFTAALWGLFLPALVPVAGEQSVGLGPVTSQEGSPQLSYPSQFLTATVYIWELPALPTSLIGASLSP